MRELNSKKRDYQDKVREQERTILKLQRVSKNLEYMHNRFLQIKGAYPEDVVAQKQREYEANIANIERAIVEAGDIKSKYQEAIGFLEMDIADNQQHKEQMDREISSRQDLEIDSPVMILKNKYDSYKIAESELDKINSSSTERTKIKELDVAHASYLRARKERMIFEYKYRDKETGALIIPEPYGNEEVIDNIPAIEEELSRLQEVEAAALAVKKEKQASFREWHEEVSQVKGLVQRYESSYFEEASIALTSLARLKAEGNKGASSLVDLSSKRSQVQARLSTGIDSIRDHLEVNTVQIERYAKEIEERKNKLEEDLPEDAKGFQSKMQSLSAQFSEACSELDDTKETLGFTAEVPRQVNDDFSGISDEVEWVGEPSALISDEDYQATMARMEDFNKRNEKLGREVSALNAKTRTLRSKADTLNAECEALSSGLQAQVETKEEVDKERELLTKERQKYEAHHEITIACKQVKSLAEQLSKTSDRVNSSELYTTKKNWFSKKIFAIASAIYNWATKPKIGLYDKAMDRKIPLEQNGALEEVKQAVDYFEKTNKNLLSREKELREDQDSATVDMIDRIKENNGRINGHKTELSDVERMVEGQEKIYKKTPRVESRGRTSGP